ncbi:unnamed protein product [Strongylus vulgaris]|uniref:Uncharacterized protein n=1 Tax=Strongylus vulgaris TaxID=40348 RepID=A0A3P7IUP4_STRVU|nr:unnamed protein product [Strongylus vulgaris]
MFTNYWVGLINEDTLKCYFSFCYLKLYQYTSLYRRFVSSANFVGWLANRSRDVNAQLKAQYVEALCSADLGEYFICANRRIKVTNSEV